MTGETPPRETEAGLLPTGSGWFVLNAKEARWRDRGPRGKSLPFDGEADFPQLGVCLFVLGDGEPIGMYHWEADQEDFLVLSGEALLIIEGEERPLRQWDFVHCPVGTNHMIVGAGPEPCAVLAVGARQHQDARAGVATPSTRPRSGTEQGSSRRRRDAGEAYARFPDVVTTRYQDGWLPG